MGSPLTLLTASKASQTTGTHSRLSSTNNLRISKMKLKDNLTQSKMVSEMIYSNHRKTPLCSGQIWTKTSRNRLLNFSSVRTALLMKRTDQESAMLSYANHRV